ncbi:MAG: DUF4133 domain-containing protein [Chitinophagaceae bacterium]|jgi:hypothetical protein|nr:DUF4133 domain-containing protein [Chitinophagaceae bacterium]
MSQLFMINKGVNRPLVFKGLKAQYIWWLGGGVLGCLFIFALLYIVGVSLFICVPLILSIGGVWFVYVYRLSNRYGEYGLIKKMAFKLLPKWIRCNQLFKS